MGVAGGYGPEIGADGPDKPWFRVGDYRLDGVRYAGSAFMDVDVRLAAMQAAGIEFQVLSPNPLTYFHHIESELAIGYCRRHNDELAALVSRHPARLAALASLPMQDPVAMGEVDGPRHLGHQRSRLARRQRVEIQQNGLHFGHADRVVATYPRCRGHLPGLLERPGVPPFQRNALERALQFERGGKMTEHPLVSHVLFDDREVSVAAQAFAGRRNGPTDLPGGHASRATFGDGDDLLVLPPSPP